MRAYSFLVAMSILLAVTMVQADVPGQLWYQGVLTDENGMAMDTTVSMTFRIYTDSTAGDEVWSESQPMVTVAGGLFEVLLGRANAIADTVFNESARWLSVQVGVEPEMQPRQPILSVGYAFRAARADTADFTKVALTENDGDWSMIGDDIYRLDGNVGIGTMSPAASLHLLGDLQVGEDSTDYDVTCYGLEGGGVMFWDGGKMALRAGRDVDGTHWSPSERGTYSFATGINSKAKGSGSTAFGANTLAQGDYATALGLETEAWGEASIAMGYGTVATGKYSTAMGNWTTAGNKRATAMGHRTTASGYSSTAIGYEATAAGSMAISLGYGTYASGWGSLAMGYITGANGEYSVAIGRYVDADSSSSISIGHGIDYSHHFVNDIPNSFMVTFHDTTAALFVGGESNLVGVGTEYPTARLDVSGSYGFDQLRIRTPYTPTGTDDVNGNVGDVAWDEDYVYIKTISGWKRAALSIW